MPPQSCSLAGGSKLMSMSKLLTAATGLLAAVCLGGGGLLWTAPRPDALPQEGTPGPKAEPGKVDRLGDPLPPGAVARLGTLRFRTKGPRLAGLGFLPDSKTLVSATATDTVQFWEAGT